ncbi:hypothetical protein E4U13_003128 [Claviceps humidiphila]|uniref:Uncharacterized protein n=1 Tax=Claviceps humidiphila TaxID=1294629 RepID=A0A9P7Q020_9HYPO|nr:hypothetical protein E4U32_005909 [Claviceps aff. humidiphila group G2b]KAG6114844.1 hypothetical protein E4U13_003128 [Claviceps humidiphila]
MKFSTVLGTFALSTLEAYRAYASPLNAVSPGQSLEERAIEYCCVQVKWLNNVENHFVPYFGNTNVQDVTSIGMCMISVAQGPTRPSQGGCSEWKGQTVQCAAEYGVKVSVQPASVCQQ